MDLPSAAQRVDGLPRYAAMDEEDEEQEQDFMEEGLKGEVSLEEAPEELEPFDAETAVTEEPAPGPAAGLNPVTDEEPEPLLESEEEPETELVEVPEELQDLEEPQPLAPKAPLKPAAEKKPPTGPATPKTPPESAPHEAPHAPPEKTKAPAVPGGAPAAAAQNAGLEPEAPEPPRSSDDVRRELRDYLNGVRGRLDNQPSKPSNPVDLLDYLGKLSDYLPEREKRQFKGSNERLAMESIKARLAGKKGLRQKVAADFTPATASRKEPMTRSLVVDTFSYLKDLAAWHPDKTVGAAMKDRIESLVARMGRSN